MKIIVKQTYLTILVALIGGAYLLSSCADGNAKETNAKSNISINNSKEPKNRKASEESKAYWYDGTAEITSYKLSQTRYGELHEGTAVLVYVTEPFSKSNRTKADQDRSDNVPVLKLNHTRKFNTGIYPYSLMNSTFFPFENESTSLKITSSCQEWCGMSYLEMNYNQTLNFNNNSYFEGSSYQNKTIENTILEDDLWSLIRLNPELLPVGEQKIIPSMFYLRLCHKELSAYKAIITVADKANSKIYTINYPELERKISIVFDNAFPHKITEWTDEHYSGYGKNKKMLATTAKLNKSLKTKYWSLNSNKDSQWRSKLGLE